MLPSTIPAASDRLIGPADIAVLRAVARYFFVTAPQVTRMLYAPTSHTYAQARLKRLADRGYLQRIMLPRPTRTGSAPYVHTVSQRGLQILAEWGPVPGGDRRVRPAEVQAHSYLHLAHTLALNDVLIALNELARTDARVHVDQVLHERELKQRPVSVDVAGRATSVIPDAWVDLRLAGDYQECYAIELDRGTTEQPAWRQKIAALAAYASGPYQSAFATTSLTVVVMTTAGAARCERLRQWTVATLRALGREDLLTLFRFTGASVHAMSPAAFFVDRTHWFTYSSSTPTTLLQFPTIATITRQHAVSGEEGRA